MDQIFKLDFLTDINYVRFFSDLILLFLLTSLIGWSYKKFIFSNDNKDTFVRNTFPFALAIFLIVSVIKTSIALSLGLVGALSIIRFRTAIKEPIQIITLLILTSLSLSMAAEKEILGVVVTVVFVLHSMLKRNEDTSLDGETNSRLLRITTQNSNEAFVQFINLTEFNRFYKNTNGEWVIEFIISSDTQLNEIISSFQTLDKNIHFEVF